MQKIPQHRPAAVGCEDETVRDTLISGALKAVSPLCPAQYMK